MDTIPMSVFWKNKESVYLGCNETFIKDCGFGNLADVVGKSPLDLFDPETATELMAHDRQVVSTNTPVFNILIPYSRQDGTAGQREASKIPLHNEEGEAVGVLEIWRDVTEQNLSEDRLKRTLEDMETEHIRNVLASVGGNKSRAAEILGIARKTLRKKLGLRQSTER